MTVMMKRFSLSFIGLFFLVTLSACVPVLVAGGVGAGALGVNERRTSGVLVEDQAIETKGQHLLYQYEKRANSHINLVSYNKRVLLTGEVPDQQFGLEVENAVREVDHVKEVINELIISEPASLNSRSQDTYITSKVKTALATNIKKEGFNAGHVKVKTDKRIVYLMGIVTREEAQVAIDITRGVSGIEEIVPLFEIQ